MNAGAWLGLLAGIAAATAEVDLQPGPPAPSRPPLPSPLPRPARNPGADADFSAAQRKFENLEADAADALQRFLASHAADGRAPLAASLLSYLAGLDALAAGRPDEAAARLQPFVGGGVPPGRVPELWGALAEAKTALGRADVLADWERFFLAGSAAEKAYARLRAEEIAGRLGAPGAGAACLRARDLACAVGGPIRASALPQGGAERTTLLAASAEARRAYGFEAPTTEPLGPRPGDPRRIGLVVPLSGRSRLLGEAALRGAILAAGALGAGRLATAPELIVRDTGSDATRAATAVRELVEREAVVAIVGAGPASAFAAARESGTPVLRLEAEAAGEEGLLQLVHAPDVRVDALVQRALGLGVRSFAVLAPDNVLGKRLSEAFRTRVLAGGGTVAVETSYVAGATSFGKAIAALAKAKFEAVFVPDSADRIELIAPALAVADLWPVPFGAAPPKSERVPGKPAARPVLLLSLATGLAARTFTAAGRYLGGALLAPGFWADDADPATAPFVVAHRSAFMSDPGAAEAYAHDGIHCVRQAIAQGAFTRQAVGARLRSAETRGGLTGALRFLPNGARQDAPGIVVVPAR